MEKRIKLSAMQLETFEELALQKIKAAGRLALYATALTDGADIGDCTVKGLDGEYLVVEIEDTENKGKES